MHLKYRPDSFDKVYGNKEVVTALKSQDPDTYKSMLFEGAPGCGKTTLAQIVAREFGADENTIKMVSCAQFPGVKEIRELMTELSTSSILGDKKVLILEEVHNLTSKPSQDALLIPLESLASNRLIIGCTTSIDNLQQPLLDRFIRYKIRPLNNNDITSLLYYVCEQENIKLNKIQKTLLLNKSEGNPRKLLTGLKKIAKVTDEEEISLLLDLTELEEHEEVLNLFKLLVAQVETKKINWNKHIKPCLNKLLKENSPNEVKSGLMNLIAFNVTSNYFKETNGGAFINWYHILSKQMNFGEKQNLIMMVFEMYSSINSKKG